MIVEAAPKEGHERSNGAAEVTVQRVHALARTIKDHVETCSGIEIGVKSPLLTWLVTHAAALITMFSKGTPPDGMTPFQRWRGRPWRVALPGFGEAIHYRRNTRHKLESRWRDGIFVGVNFNTTEKIVADREGVYVVASIRRAR